MKSLRFLMVLRHNNEPQRPQNVDKCSGSESVRFFVRTKQQRQNGNICSFRNKTAFSKGIYFYLMVSVLTANSLLIIVLQVFVIF